MPHLPRRPVRPPAARTPPQTTPHPQPGELSRPGTHAGPPGAPAPHHPNRHRWTGGGEGGKPPSVGSRRTTHQRLALRLTGRISEQATGLVPGSVDATMRAPVEADERQGATEAVNGG